MIWVWPFAYMLLICVGAWGWHLWYTRHTRWFRRELMRGIQAGLEAERRKREQE